MKRYTTKEVEIVISQCADAGYNIVTLREGSLGYGHMVLIAPTEADWNYEIIEQYLNEWSSTHTIRRLSKISKRLRSMIEEAQNGEMC